MDLSFVGFFVERNRDWRGRDRKRREYVHDFVDTPAETRVGCMVLGWCSAMTW